MPVAPFAVTPGVLQRSSPELDVLPFRSATFSPDRVSSETLEHLTRDEGRLAPRRFDGSLASPRRCPITMPNDPSHRVLFEWLLDGLLLTPPLTKGQHVSRYASDALARAADTHWLARLASRFVQTGSRPSPESSPRRIGTLAIGVEARRTGHAAALLYAVCEATP